LHITIKDMTEMRCIDGVVPEPEGGAHTDHEAAAALLDSNLQQHLSELKQMSLNQLLDSRYKKFRHMTQFFRQEV
jgi:acetyl-CoA carboxylase carboxyl transferase subunit alpha